MKTAIKLSIVLVSLVLTLSAKAQNLSDYRWTTIETKGAPTGRHENSFVEYKGKFYLLGGRGINPVDVYDPKTNTWEAKSKSPMQIHHFQAVVYKDAIYMIGAMSGGYPNEPALENIWMYYPEKDKWVKGPKIPEARRRGGAGTVIYNDKIYMACGIKVGHTSGTNNYFDCYDLKTGEWKQLTDAPHIRDHFPAIVVNDKMYCIGGRNSSVHNADNFGAFFSATETAVDYYDFKEEKWFTLKEPLPIGTAAGALVSVDNKILYIGGEGTQAQAYNNTQCLDLQTEKWSQLSTLVTGRHGSGAVLFDNSIYLPAGSSMKGGGNMTSMEIFTADHAYQPLFANEYPLDIDSICVHDPCILADPITKLYYLYGNYEPDRKWSKVEFPAKRAGVQTYVSKDLKNWSLPRMIFEVPDGFWGDKQDAPWAPEVHYLYNKYYLFVTFNKWDSIMDVRADRPKITLRASQILVSDTPTGPFKSFENRQTTLDGDMTLDATLYVENGTPYIVYCHEWVQKGVGTIEALKLRSDLSKPIGKPFQVISAAEVNWDKDTVNYKTVPTFGSVTDGCYFYKTKTGKLLLLWSSWHRTRQYVQSYAISESGSIKGPWKHIEEPILLDDRGHGMTFKGFDGKLYLCLHRYFHSPATRVQIWEVEDNGNGLNVVKQKFGAK